MRSVQHSPESVKGVDAQDPLSEYLENPSGTEVLFELLLEQFTNKKTAVAGSAFQ